MTRPDPSQQAGQDTCVVLLAVIPRWLKGGLVGSLLHSLRFNRYAEPLPPLSWRGLSELGHVGGSPISDQPLGWCTVCAPSAFSRHFSSAPSPPIKYCHTGLCFLAPRKCAQQALLLRTTRGCQKHRRLNLIDPSRSLTTGWHSGTLQWFVLLAVIPTRLPSLADRKAIQLDCELEV